MPRTSKQTPVKSKKPATTNLPFHAFWSGSLSFGLVNVPVQMFPATRHSEVRLRLMSPQGALLERHFFCPSDEQEVAPDEIVRGYELEDGTYIVVDDEELEALEPQKSREIDLQEFVDLSELPPSILERGYYLTPQKDATKAYRLLAEVMEQTQQAGIATFVMRDREYLVAIFREMAFCARGDAPVQRRDSRSRWHRLAEAVSGGQVPGVCIRALPSRAFPENPLGRRAGRQGDRKAEGTDREEAKVGTRSDPDRLRFHRVEFRGRGRGGRRG